MITKSVSCFARNTVGSLSAIQTLKEGDITCLSPAKITQEDVSLLMSHINSYTRKKLNDQSANQLFSFLYGEDTLAKLGIKVILANEINLTPYLLKK